MPRGGGVPAEALSALRRRLLALPARHPERSTLMASTAQLYAVSRATLYRLLRGDRRPKDAHRADVAVHARCRRTRSSGIEVAPFQWTISRLAGYVVVMVACMSAS